MSRQSAARKAAKKARRLKRQTVQGTTRTPEPLLEDGPADAIAQAVTQIDEWMAARGWVLDAANGSANLVSWVYPPSAADFDDDEREPVTRIWINVAEDDDEVVLEFGAVLVGAAGADDIYLLDPQTLPDDIAALEAYRPGQDRPEFD